MSQFQSSLITPDNCRKILRVWHTGRFSSSLMSAGRNCIYLSYFMVVVEGDKISLYRTERGQTRRVFKAEIPSVERRFRRVLEQEIEPFLAASKHPPQFEPLAVDLAALLELLDLVLAGVTANVRQKAERFVRLAVEKPGAWLQKYGRRRGLNKPTKNLHVLAFFDALIDARAAAELDHRSEPEELAYELRRIGRRLSIHIDAPSEDQMSQALRALHRSLKLAGWALILVDINSDSHPFFVVPMTQHKRIQTLMRKLHFTLAKV